MRRFLMSFTNDRNKEQRISTDNETMLVDIFYRDAHGTVRKIRMSVEAGNDRSLFAFFHSDGKCESIHMVGEESAKLPFVSR